MNKSSSKSSDPLNRKSVRKALRSWHNSQQLGEHPLARLGLVEARRKAAGYRQTPIGYGVALRDVLHHAIKASKPCDESPDPFDKSWRTYLILSETYISGRSPAYVSDQLSIARSTYDHAQASALDGLVGLLREWDQHETTDDPVLAFLLPERPPIRKVPFLAPPKSVPTLIGRETILSDLKERLRTINGQPMIALSGLPGVGKTTLALDLAHDPEIQETFADGVLWVGLGQKPDLMTLISLWGIALGLPLDEMGKLDRFDDRAKAIHAAIGMRRMLLVIDDLWETGEGLAFKIGGVNCAYVVTTRLPKVAFEIAGESVVEIPELEEEEGFILLEQFAPQVCSAEPEIARNLVREAGGLPLALVLTGRFLAREALSGQQRRIQAALDRLRDTGERLRLSRDQSPLEKQPSLQTSEPLSLHAAIDLSVNALEETSREALIALSALPPKPNTFSEEAALAIASTSEKDLDHLVDFGLLESTAQARYAMNNSIRAYARANLADEIAFVRLVDYFTKFANSHANVFSVLGIDLQNILAALELAFDSGLHSQLIHGANAVYPFLEARGLLEQAQVLLNRAEDASRMIGAPTDLICTLENLGRFAQRRGSYELAAAYFREGLEITQEKGTEEGMTPMLQGLGVVAFSRGDHLGAVQHYLKALEIARKYTQRARMSAILANLGALTFSRGDVGEAERYLREGLALARELEDRGHISALLMNLGAVLARKGDFDSAEMHFQESLELAHAGGNRKNECYLLSNLGALANDRGDGRRAEGYFLEALALARELDDRARVSHLLANIGAIAIAQEDYPLGETYLIEGLQIAREIEHLENTILSLLNLGVLKKEQGEHDQARSHFEEALTIAKKMAHRRYLGILHRHLGDLHLVRQAWDAASVSYRKSLKPAIKMRSEEHILRALTGYAATEVSRKTQSEVGPKVKLKDLMDILQDPIREEFTKYIADSAEPEDVDYTEGELIQIVERVLIQLDV
jgi:tetratricopeptide (TPR) repeat protein